MDLSKPAVLIASGAVSAGVFASAAFGSAPAANATCASFFGIGNSANCTSTQTSIAIAIGPAARARNYGTVGSAVAFGAGAIAYTYGAANAAFALGDHTIATAGPNGASAFGVATAVGNDSFAATYGFLSLAFSAHGNSGAGGTNSFANVAVALGTTGKASADALGTANLAIDAFGHGDVGSNGTGNVAVNLCGSNVFVTARGRFNNATNLLGAGNTVNAGVTKPATGSWAFAVLGKDNLVEAEPGPLAVAGSIFQTGAMVHKAGPGFNINGVVAGGAAAVPAAQSARSAAGTGHAPAHHSVAGSPRASSKL